MQNHELMVSATPSRFPLGLLYHIADRMSRGFEKLVHWIFLWLSIILLESLEYT